MSSPLIFFRHLIYIALRSFLDALLFSIQRITLCRLSIGDTQGSPLNPKVSKEGVAGLTPYASIFTAYLPRQPARQLWHQSRRSLGFRLATLP